MGVYCRGVAAGPCWQWSEGGGWLTGSVDGEGAFTGDNIAFLYPDLRCHTGPLYTWPLYTWPLYTWPLYTWLTSISTHVPVLVTGRRWWDSSVTASRSASSPPPSPGGMLLCW